VQSNFSRYDLRIPETKEEWQKYYFLRWKILRSEFSDDIDSAKDDLEYSSYHIAAFSKDSSILGVGRIHHIDIENAQIRYMAVDLSCREQLVGSNILLNLIKNAKDYNKKFIILHARENAVNFYKNNGFKLIRKTHLLFGKIQHYLMKLSL
tara:strand:+ start:1569 stop:2021 length:453 start_codon:yes stop_codon:yes gene_type:complete